MKKIFSVVKEPGESIIAFIARIEELVQRLSELEIKNPIDTVITKIIMSLPLEYNNFNY